ncbi:MAG: HyaD/HybD family hydrogenase maturation endopeptidase [Desulfopila sp.]
MDMTKNIGIAGIGNLLLADEGFGVHVVKFLQDNYSFPANVDIQDIGTAGIYMAPFLESCDPVLVIDVVDIAGEPGSFHFFTLAEVQAGTFQTRLSPHQLGLLEILEICKLRDTAPRQVEFFTIVPQELSEGLELSKIAAERKVEVAEAIIARLRQLGVPVQRRAAG